MTFTLEFLSRSIRNRLSFHMEQIPHLKWTKLEPAFDSQTKLNWSGPEWLWDAFIYQVHHTTYVRRCTQSNQ